MSVTFSHLTSQALLSINPSNAWATFTKSTRMQRLLKNNSKPSFVGIHWIALAEHSQMTTHVPGFQSYFKFLHHFVLAKLATNSIRVLEKLYQNEKCTCVVLMVLCWHCGNTVFARLSAPCGCKLENFPVAGVLSNIRITAPSNEC